ncbi:MAG: ABC transporter ATP-binding protein [Lachnospiraceae bacterium]|nr:ABC transporter ATP-binding protein [Lachnospiraceae bacterium]
MDAIKVRGLTKKYKNFTLDGVSFSVPSGAIVGFIGENGAGKTTTIKAMLGLIQADSGSVELLGHTPKEADGSWKEEIGVVFDEGYFPENVTPLNVEKILGRIYRTWDGKTFQNYLTRFAVPRETRYKELSRGMKMKLSMAVALSHGARLLILDEATSGLDPVVRSELLDLFLEFIQEEDHAIFLSSHITSDIEKISDYILLIHQGRVLLYENKDVLMYQYGLVRCSREQYEKLSPKHCRGYRKGAFGYEVLVDNREELGQAWDCVVDKISLEDLLVFLTRKEP